MISVKLRLRSGMSPSRANSRRKSGLMYKGPLF